MLPVCIKLSCSPARTLVRRAVYCRSTRPVDHMCRDEPFCWVALCSYVLGVWVMQSLTFTALSVTSFATAILHWPFLKTLGPAPLSRTRPGRENGDACRARWAGMCSRARERGLRSRDRAVTNWLACITPAQPAVDRSISWQNTMKLKR